MLVKVWTVKAILMRPWMEMRNILLTNGGKVILVTKWQRVWLNCLCLSILWKVKLVSDETGYLMKKFLSRVSKE